MSLIKNAKSKFHPLAQSAHPDLKTHFKESIKDYPEAKVMTLSNKALLFLGGMAATAAIITGITDKTDVSTKPNVELRTYTPQQTEQPDEFSATEDTIPTQVELGDIETPEGNG